MNPKKATIAIPTYKRPNELKTLIHDIISQGIHDLVELLIIDDGPTTDIIEFIEPYQEFIKLIQHKQNKGYAMTFIECVEVCQTEYLIMMVDDDRLIRKGIEEVLQFLENNSPDFISTVWLRNDKIHRGQKEIKNVSIKNIGQASIHAPGLIYKVKTTKENLFFLKERLSKNCTTTFYMPQVVLVYLMKLKNKECIWHPAFLSKEGDGVESNLKDSSGDYYYTVVGRWKSSRSYIELFEDMSKLDLSKNNKAKALALKKSIQLELYKRITSGIDNPDLLNSWIAASIIYNIKNLPKTLMLIFKWILNYIKINRLLKD